MPFLGMRGTGDWTDNERPEDWRETILYLYPNGKAPLTAIMSMMDSEETSDPHFHWFPKQMPLQAGEVTGTYTDSSLSTAYDPGTNGTAQSGDVLYFQTDASTAGEFREGHNAQITVKQDPRYETVGRVTDTMQNGSDSYVAVTLREDADGSYDLDDADWIEVVGNSNPEGATMPPSVSYDVEDRGNYTQIFRTPLSITRTARQTRLRTGEALNRMKKEALELHSIEMEKAFIWGIKSVVQGANGKPERTTRGIKKAYEQFAPQNIFDYRFDSDYSGQTWLDGGEEWFNDVQERIFRHGETEKLALVGSGALQAVNDLAKSGAHYNLEAREMAYGIKVIEWVTPHGTLYLKTAPLMTQSANHRRSMLVIEPSRLRTRYVQDTMYKNDNSEDRNTNNSRDGTEEEYLTESGLEHHHELVGGFFSGMGFDNQV